mgnify:CR=1 FL=1
MFGAEPVHLQGLLTTYEEFDNIVQKLAPQTKNFVDKYLTTTGRWLGLLKTLDAIHAKAELTVKGTESRDAPRVIELARKSHEQGVTVAWT